MGWQCSTNTDGKKGDGLVDAAEGGHIDGLTTNGTLRSNTGGILSGSSVDDGVDQNLQIHISLLFGSQCKANALEWGSGQ